MTSVIIYNIFARNLCEIQKLCVYDNLLNYIFDILLHYCYNRHISCAWRNYLCEIFQSDANIFTKEGKLCF